MSVRLVERYNAALDAAHRWPDWLIGASPLFGQRAAETVSAHTRIIGFCQELWDRDPVLCTGHAVVHLDLHYDHLDHLTGDMCKEADWLARIRLDRHDECPMADMVDLMPEFPDPDDDPTVPYPAEFA